MSDLKSELDHLKHHVPYPANRKQVLAACSNMGDWGGEDKKWFEKSLPDGTYRGPDEIVKALLSKV